MVISLTTLTDRSDHAGVASVFYDPLLQVCGKTDVRPSAITPRQDKVRVYIMTASKISRVRRRTHEARSIP